MAIIVIIIIILKTPAYIILLAFANTDIIINMQLLFDKHD